MLDQTQTANQNPAAIPDRRPVPIQFTAVLVTQILLLAGSCLLVAFLPYLFSQEETEIVTYTAPKESSRNPAAATTAAPGKPGRLWGVIVPRETDVWYFKLTGPIESVKQREPDLREFIQQVKFDNDLPTWKLPDNWTQQPGNQFRFATILVPTEKKPLELTISKLPRNDSLEQLLLANVNRWREQMTLPELTAEQLTTETERIVVAGAESTLVSLEGVLKPSSMTRPPFAR